MLTAKDIRQVTITAIEKRIRKCAENCEFYCTLSPIPDKEIIDYFKDNGYNVYTAGSDSVVIRW